MLPCQASAGDPPRRRRLSLRVELGIAALALLFFWLACVPSPPRLDISDVGRTSEQTLEAVQTSSTALSLYAPKQAKDLEEALEAVTWVYCADNVDMHERIVRLKPFNRLTGKQLLKKAAPLIQPYRKAQMMSQAGAEQLRQKVLMDYNP